MERQSPLPSRGGGLGVPIPFPYSSHKRENGTRNGIPGVTPSPNSMFMGVEMMDNLHATCTGMKTNNKTKTKKTNVGSEQNFAQPQQAL